MPKLSTLLLALVVALLALGYGVWRLSGLNEAPQTAESGQAAIGGPFTLVDQQGETRTEESFAGQFRLIYFGYTYCPDVCPTALWAMSQALDQLEERNPELARQVTPIFVTVDPERDTVEHLAGYAESFHPRMVALTGSQEQVAETARAFRVFYRKVEDDASADYLMDHSSFIFIMGPDGRYLSHATHQQSPDELLEVIERAVAAAPAS